MPRHLFLITVCGLWLTAHAVAAQTLNLTPSSGAVLGQPIEITIGGEDTPVGAKLIVETTDGFRSRWRSETVLTTDLVSRNPDGGWRLSDVHRLFWSASRTFADESLSINAVPDPFVAVTLTLEREGRPSVVQEYRQWIQAPGVTRTPAESGVVGSLYAPAIPSGVGVLVVGGSGGGMTWSQQIAAVLASNGHHALGVSYFNSPGIPEALVQIPLEYFETAIAQLRRTPGVDPDKIVVLTQSWSTQAALLIGISDQRLGGVIAYVPGMMVVQGLTPQYQARHASWSRGGRDMPYLPMTLPDGMTQPEDPIERWMILLADHDLEAAAIPIEQVTAPVLLLSGKADRIWPSRYMAEKLDLRAASHGREAQVVHHAYSAAGHGITQPPFTPTTTVGARNGGTSEGNAAGRLGAWAEVLAFLDRIRQAN